jgi:hypothetical protein
LVLLDWPSWWPPTPCGKGLERSGCLLTATIALLLPFDLRQVVVDPPGAMSCCAVVALLVGLPARRPGG